MNRGTPRLVALLPLLALLSWGCGDDPTGIEGSDITPGLPEVEGPLEIAPDPFHPSLAEGDTLQLTACWKLPGGQLGRPIFGATEIVWNSDTPEVAEVTQDGWVRGHHPGLTTITVTATFRFGGSGGPLWSRTYTGSTPVTVK